MFSKVKEDLFYLSIILWPFIFVLNEIIGFPTVLMTLIFLFIGEFYLYINYRKRFYIINSLLLVGTLSQLIIVSTKLNFNNNLSDIAQLVKFSIRWCYLIILMYIFSIKEEIKKLKVFIKCKIDWLYKSAMVALLVEGISLCLKSSYEEVWGGTYFKSIFYNPHVNSYFLIVVMSAFMISFYYKKKNIISIPIIATLVLNLLTGARATGILAIIIFIFFITPYLLKNKAYIKIIIIAVIIGVFINCIFGFINLMDIPLVKKTIEVLGDPSGILNGRNYIWGNMYKYFINHFSFINLLFGVGLSQTMHINNSYIQQSLWAHNDLIETFIGGGLYCLSIYLGVFFNYIKNTKEYVLMTIIILILFFNGLFVYSELVVFIPIITILGQNIFNEINSKEIRL